MAMLITDTELVERLKAERKAARADRYDEVWDGVSVMAPLPTNEHQELVGKLTTVLEIAVGWPELGKVFPGANVSDRTEGWEQNFRCPNVAVFLNDTRAKNCGTHWYGGPDFAIEIVSPDDRSREKFDFYAAVGVRELLLIDRDPWKLGLYRLQGDRLAEAGESTLENAITLASEAVPLSWRLVSGEKRPRIEIVHTDGQQRWTV